MSDLVERYLDVWNETDASKRQALIGELFAEDATYLDPLGEAHGRAAIDAAVAAAHEQFPGFVFTPVGTADAHHTLTRFTWGLGPTNADPVIIGFDVAVTNPTGQITTIHGFLNKLPT